MKFLNKFKPHKKIVAHFITRQGECILKKIPQDNGRIYFEGKAYAFSSQDIVRRKRKSWLFFFEDNPHAINLKHKNAPVLDAEAFKIALKMEAIKAIEEADDRSKKEMQIVIFLTAVITLISILTSLRVFTII